MKKTLLIILLLLTLFLCSCKLTTRGLDIKEFNKEKYDIEVEVIAYKVKDYTNNVYEITAYIKYEDYYYKEIFVFKGKYNGELIYYEVKTKESN